MDQRGHVASATCGAGCPGDTSRTRGACRARWASATRCPRCAGSTCWTSPPCSAICAIIPRRTSRPGGAGTASWASSPISAVHTIAASGPRRTRDTCCTRGPGSTSRARCARGAIAPCSPICAVCPRGSGRPSGSGSACRALGTSGAVAARRPSRARGACRSGSPGCPRRPCSTIATRGPRRPRRTSCAGGTCRTRCPHPTERNGPTPPRHALADVEISSVFSQEGKAAGLCVVQAQVCQGRHHVGFETIAINPSGTGGACGTSRAGGAGCTRGACWAHVGCCQGQRALHPLCKLQLQRGQQRGKPELDGRGVRHLASHPQ